MLKKTKRLIAKLAARGLVHIDSTLTSCQLGKQGFFWGGGAGGGIHPPLEVSCPPLERHTIHIHNDILWHCACRKLPLIDGRSCMSKLNVLCSFLTHKLSIASRSVREEAISLPHSHLGVYIITYVSHPKYCLLVFEYIHDVTMYMHHIHALCIHCLVYLFPFHWLFPADIST